MTKERNNPWAGLASYEDPAKSERKLKFCGRDNDIYDVTRLIDDNLLLILYGKSGIGKTSLLNAGVFPELRKEQYLPVSIRLGTLEVSASYQEAIVYAIEKAIEEAHGSITVYHVVEEQTDDHQPDLLWNYFARHRFANAEGQPLFPVVVLDQFEEVLRNTSPEHVEKAQTLLNQLQYLIDESHALNDCVVDGQDYFYDFNFRFIISIREDELYLLEDNIDDLSLSMFRNCRYRLRPMKTEQARQVVLIPGKDCIEENEKEIIANRIVLMSRHNEQNSIDTILLSLICAEIYNIALQNKTFITKAMVDDLGDNILYSFYETAMRSVSPVTVKYIEFHLLTQSGFRNSIAMEDILHEGIKKEDIDKLVEKRLLRIEYINGIERVEFTHDALCAMAKTSRDKNLQKSNRKSKVSHNIGYVFDIVAPMIIVFFSILYYGIFDYSILDNICLLLVMPIYFVLFPYRHSKERNSMWFTLLSSIIALVIGVILYSSFLSEINDDVGTFVFFPALVWSVYCFYVLFHFVLSFTFKKKRTFKEALQYVLKFDVYKEYPKFKKIILIVSIVTISMLVVVFVGVGMFSELVTEAENL